MDMTPQEQEQQLLPAERFLAMIAHLVALVGFMVPLGPIVIGNVLAPLGLWLGTKKQSKYVEQHARESTNFQITITLFLFIDQMILRDVAHLTIFYLVFIYVVIVAVLAAIKAFRGKQHKYALSLRYLR